MEDSPFESLLNTLSKLDPDRRENKRKLPEAEAIQCLKVAYAIFSQPSTLKPGDIVRGIKDLTESHMRGWDEPHIVLEILAEPVLIVLDPETVGHNTAAKRYDAILASIVPRPQGGVMRHYGDLREYELYPLPKDAKTDS